MRHFISADCEFPYSSFLVQWICTAVSPNMLSHFKLTLFPSEPLAWNLLRRLMFIWARNLASLTYFGKWSSVQFCRSVMSDSVTPWITAHQASLSITISRSSLKLMSIESVMPSSHVILCHPLLLLPPIPPGIRVFSNESTLHMKWPKYWSFSFRIIPSKERPGLISFRMDWLDLLAVQGTLKSLLQHQFKSINSSALSLLHSPTLTSIHDQWKNHSLD